jgi:hypothetical protein
MDCPLSMTTASSLSEDYAKARALAPPEPGLVLVFGDGEPRARVFPLKRGALELGRAELSVSAQFDPLISRKHVRFGFQDGSWRVADLGSRNGTLLAGKRLQAEVSLTPRTVVRVGGALLMRWQTPGPVRGRQLRHDPQRSGRTLAVRLAPRRVFLFAGRWR